MWSHIYREESFIHVRVCGGNARVQGGASARRLRFMLCGFEVRHLQVAALLSLERERIRLSIVRHNLSLSVVCLTWIRCEESSESLLRYTAGGLGWNENDGLEREDEGRGTDRQAREAIIIQ